MPIQNEKPEPIQLGNKYYYTLSSYDPVLIHVEIPRVTDADVDMALESIVGQEGATLPEADDAWIAEHFEGVGTLAEIRSRLHSQLEQMNAAYAEDSKLSLAVLELAKRLVQRVPEREIALFKEAFAQQFDLDLSKDGMTRADFLERTGSTPDMLDRMFDERAREMAEQVAALEAFIDERGITVEDDELEGLLGVPAEHAAELIEQAKSEGTMDDVRIVALRNKASRIVMSECSCVYVHESPEDAQRRVAAFRRMADQAAKLD
ncbi:MAG: hypothetical protein IJH87_04295 [Atopobiaceae bacterium]|nr:hypothetical protein [Atopobiaceae bacterium]